MIEVKRGACHCGEVEFEITIREGLKNLRRCNCSLCRRKGIIMADIDATDIRILRGENKLTAYQWNTKIAKHYFCGICGIYTHHKKRSEPTRYGFNIACLEDVDPFDIGKIALANGASMTLVDEDAT